MRPVRLELQGFTCYREKQVVDFTSLGVFAIAGPTGSGKSSLLDAITFALYGKVPRLGGQNLDEFISLGASRASVVLDFDMQGERFRVVRSMPRSGAKRAQVEQITDGAEKALGDGVGEVNEKVRALLGLDYEAFIQSVLLPQGDFARFLKSNPKDQQKILRDLLRLGIYEKMRERAANEARELAGSIEAARTLLEGPYAQATPANVKLIEEELADVLKKKHAATTELAACGRMLQTVQGQWKLINDRRQRSDSLDRLDRDRPEIDKLKTIIACANRARSIIPALDAAAAKTKALKDVGIEARELERKLAAAQDDLNTQAADLHSVEEKALDLPPKRARILELASVVPVIAEHRSWTKRLNEIAMHLAKSENAIAARERRVSEIKACLEIAQREHEELVQRQTGLGYDVTAHTILKNAQRLAYELAQARENEQNLVAPLEAARESQQQADGAHRANEISLKTAEERYSAAVEVAQAAFREFTEAQNQDRAAALQSTLHTGCRCPVCEQPVNELPLAAIPPDLQRTERAVQVAEAERTIAESSLQMARQATVEAKGRVEAARKGVDELEKQSGWANRKLNDSASSLKSAIHPLECPPGSLLEYFVEQEFATFERMAADFRKVVEDLAKSALTHQRAEAALEGAKRDLAAAEETRDRLGREIAEAERHLREYTETIAAVQSADPEKEMQVLRCDVSNLEGRLQQVTDLHRDAELTCQAIERSCTGARTRLASATGERDQAEISASNALSSAGFAGEPETRAAMLAESVITDGEARIATFEDEVKQLSARIKELNTQLSGVVITETDVDEAARRVNEGQALLNRFTHRFGELNGQIQKLRSDTEKAEMLRLEQKCRISRCGVVQQLMRDLRSDCFQQYLLEGSFRRLVTGASSRLRQLDDRYELVFADGKFAVVDHDHGSQTRLADTLSGGETFLVSLALAFELSEQVQQAAGAVRLDSLFIDEGFGTLDSETLETVAEAIESLGKTNRMVGVITHVAELHRRLPRLDVSVCHPRFKTPAISPVHEVSNTIGGDAVGTLQQFLNL